MEVKERNNLSGQGVSTSDMAWWEGLGPEGQQQIEHSTQAWNMAMFQQMLAEGAGSQALQRMYKQALVYAYYPLREDSIREWQELGFTEEDYPLPWQLHNRCDQFIWHCFNNGKQNWFQDTAKTFSTMNAFFRELIRTEAI